MNRAMVTIRFTNRNGTHEKKTYFVKLNGNSDAEAMEKAFDRYLQFNGVAYEDQSSPKYHRPCELWEWKFCHDIM